MFPELFDAHAALGSTLNATGPNLVWRRPAWSYTANTNQRTEQASDAPEQSRIIWIGGPTKPPEIWGLDRGAPRFVRSPHHPPSSRPGLCDGAWPCGGPWVARHSLDAPSPLT